MDVGTIRPAMVRLIAASAAIAAALTLAASPASASMHYFQYRVYTSWANPNTEPSTSDTGWVHDAGFSTLYGSTGYAWGMSSFDNRGIHVDAELNMAAGPHSGLVQSMLQWRDVVRLVSPDPPDMIKVTFDMHGNFSNSGGPSWGYMTAGVGQIPGSGLLSGDEVLPQAADFGGSVAMATINVGGDQPGEEPNNGYVIPGRDLFYTEADSVSAYWLADFYLPYDEEAGGYVLNFLASNRNEMSLGDRDSSDSHFAETFRLSSVTNADGSALGGPITFDSGYTLQAVPEPSGLVLAGVGACALGALRVGKSMGGRWRRRRSRHRLPSRDEA